MRFTVILPVHNSERYLVECLDSLSAQIYKDFEALCIDDNSKDGTVSIINSYAESDSRIKLIEDPNGSYGHKINLGIDNALGEYICILESDDYYCDDTLESFAKIIDIFHPDLVDGDYNRFGEINNKKIFYRMYKYEYPSMYNYLQLGDTDYRELWYRASAIWTGAYCRDFLIKENIRMNESPGASYQDTSFRFLTLILARSMYHMGKVQYQYRVDNPASSVLDKSKVYTIEKEYKFLKKELELRKIQIEEIWDQFYRWKYTAYLWNIQRLDFDNAIKFSEVIIRDMEIDKLAFSKNLKMGLGEFQEAIKLRENVVQYIQDAHTLFEDEKLKCKERIEACSIFRNSKIVLLGDPELVRKFYKIISPIRSADVLCFAKNGFNVETTYVDGIELLEICNIVEKWKNAKYIIISVDMSDVFETKLTEMGIDKESICRIKNLSIDEGGFF